MSNHHSLKYWPTHIGLVCLRLINRLPFGLQLAIGKSLGNTFRRVAKKRVHIARRNLELCFPKKSTAEKEAILSQHFESTGMGMIESMMAWWGSQEKIRSLCEVRGIEHLSNVLDSGQGVIMLTGHFTPMELGSRAISTYVKYVSMYRPMKNPVMDAATLKARKTHLPDVIPRNDVRAIVRKLKQGDAVWYGFDQDYGRKHSIFTPFFGVPAATIVTTSRLAKMANAKVVPYFTRRTPDNRYIIEIQPPLENFPSKDIEADTRRLNQLLEKAILKAPEQYFWVHRRFKTRPNEQKPVY